MFALLAFLYIKFVNANYAECRSIRDFYVARRWLFHDLPALARSSPRLYYIVICVVDEKTTIKDALKNS